MKKVQQKNKCMKENNYWENERAFILKTVESWQPESDLSPSLRPETRAAAPRTDSQLQQETFHVKAHIQTQKSSPVQWLKQIMKKNE